MNTIVGSAHSMFVDTTDYRKPIRDKGQRNSTLSPYLSRARETAQSKRSRFRTVPTSTESGSEGMINMKRKQISKDRMKTLLINLNEQDKHDFLDELLDASLTLYNEESALQLEEILESWEATAEILEDEDLVQEINEARQEAENGDVVRWHPGM